VKESDMPMNDQTSLSSSRTQAPDRDPQVRPGVPMIPERPAALTPTEPARQKATVPVLVSVDVGELTPVFSTAVPPRGLSGLMRRRAYAIPEHQARRWLMLLVADRVDVWENRVRERPWVYAGLAAGVVALAMAPAALRPRRKSWWQRLV